MDPSLIIKKRFTPEDQPKVGYLGQFTLALVQSLLKTGYYKPGHPGIKTAMQGLYQDWSHLAQYQRDLSFMIDDQSGEAGILVYGALSDVTPLKNLFMPDMSELFIPKFRDYFDRRRMVSFTIKPEITFDEFEGFIDLMSAPPDNLDMQQAISKMTENLVSRQIVHISVIYEAELFSKRSLHWMTQIALARLNKDLRLIPLYTHLAPEQMLVVKARVFCDLVRPLGNMTVLKEVLIHCDQLAVISLSGESEAVDIEAEFSRSLYPAQHLKVLLECARDLAAASPRTSSEPPEPDQLLYQRLRFIVYKMAADLSFDALEAEDATAVITLLETLMRNNILEEGALPEKWKRTLAMKKQVDDYLHNPEAVHARLTAGWTEEVTDLIQILPALLNQNPFKAFEDLIGHLERAWEKSKGALGDPFYAAIGVHQMDWPAKLQDRQFSHRKELMAMIERTGQPRPETLISFCMHEDIWLRRNICRMLARAGQALIGDLIQWAKEPNRHWQGIRNAVMILGDMGLSDNAALSFLKRCRLHPRQRVREEVIASYGKIRGDAALELLLVELMPKEPEKGLVRQAILALGNFRPVPEPFLAFLKEGFRKKRKDEPQTDEKIEVASCLAVEAMASFDFETAQSFEPILIHALTPEKSSLLSLTGKHQEKEYATRAAICRLLGVIGTERAVLLLADVLKGKPWLPEDRAMVKQAMDNIAQRCRLTP